MVRCVRKAKHILVQSRLKKNVKSKTVLHTKIRSKYAHFGPFLSFLGFLFFRILEIIRDYHPKPTPHTLHREEKATEGGDVGEGVKIRQGGFREGLRLDGSESQRQRGRLIEFFPFFSPDTNRHFFYPASVLVLVWAPQVSWF